MNYFGFDFGLDSDFIWNRCSGDDSDEDIDRNAEDKETEIMEDLAMAQAMEPKNDVSLPYSLVPVLHASF